MTDTVVLAVAPTITIKPQKQELKTEYMVFVDTGVEDQAREVRMFQVEPESFYVEVNGYDKLDIDAATGVAKATGSVEFVHKSGSEFSRTVFKPVYQISAPNGVPLAEAHEVASEVKNSWVQALSKAFIDMSQSGVSEPRMALETHQTKPNTGFKLAGLGGGNPLLLVIVSAASILFTLLVIFLAQGILNSANAKDSKSTSAEPKTAAVSFNHSANTDGSPSFDNEARQQAAYNSVQVKSTEDFLKQMGIDPQNQTAGLGCLTQ